MSETQNKDKGNFLNLGKVMSGLRNQDMDAVYLVAAAVLYLLAHENDPSLEILYGTKLKETLDIFRS